MSLNEEAHALWTDFPEVGAPGMRVLFASELLRPNIFTEMISSIIYKKDQTAIVSIEPVGLKFLVEEIGQLQSLAIFQKSLFKEYRLAPVSEPLKFRIQLSVLFEVLNILGQDKAHTALRIIYENESTDLILHLKEGDGRKGDAGHVITHVKLRTLEYEGHGQFNFFAQRTNGRAILESSAFRDGLSELDWTSNRISIMFSPDAPFFRLTTQGNMGSCQVDFPRPAFQSFSCQQIQSESYKLSLLQPCLKALTLSSETYIRINSEGVLLIQNMIHTDSGQDCFSSYMLVPGDEDGDASGSDTDSQEA